MKIDIISDIHLDFWISPKNNQMKQYKNIEFFIKNKLSIKKGEVLFIAGDIGHYNKQNKIFIELLSKLYKRLFITWGNHDLYLITGNIRKKYKTSLDRMFEFMQDCNSLENVIFLNGEVIEYNNCKIFGSGLWYKAKNLKKWQQSMSDASYIVMNDGYFDFDIDSYGKKRKYHFNPNKLYETELLKLKNLKSADIILSHVPPLLPPQKNQDPYDCYYHFNGEKFIEKFKTKLWIFGHLHNSYDFYYKNTRFISNALGYPNENKEFKVKRVTL